MSIYAQYPVSGFLSHQASLLWFAPITIQPMTSLSPPRLPHSSRNKARRSLHFLRINGPPIVVIDDTSTSAGDSSTGDFKHSLRTPSRHTPKYSTNSSIPLWPDDRTLTNTPRLFHTIEDGVCSSASHKSSLRELLKSFTPTTSQAAPVPTSIVSPSRSSSPHGSSATCVLSDDFRFNANADAQPGSVRISSDEGYGWVIRNTLEEFHGVHEVLPEVKQQPTLRRSNGEDDLNKLYRYTASRSSRPLSFEEQLTLAVLAELERDPHCFGSRHQDHCHGIMSKLNPARVALGSLGNLCRSLGSPVARLL